MDLTFVSHRFPPGRAALMAAAAAGAALFAAPAARAAPVSSVSFSDGKVLNVGAVVGSGSNTAYLAVDFSDGVDEAFQYNFNGSLNGYSLLTGVEAATTLRDTDVYYASYAEHFIYYITDGSNTTAEYPALYDTSPTGGDATQASAQGITYEQAPVGADQLNVTNGEILGFDNSYTAVPVLPETAAVPEPATLAMGSVVLSCALLRRRDRPARA